MRKFELQSQTSTISSFIKPLKSQNASKASFLGGTLKLKKLNFYWAQIGKLIG